MSLTCVLMTSENILFWNVRGLIGKARRDSVKEFVVHERVSVLCAQETKLQVVCNQVISSMLGPMFLTSQVAHPSKAIVRRSKV